MDFKERLVVVTGASSGLGREIARRLAYVEDADLVIAARRRDRLEELKAEIEGRCRSRVHVVCVDLGLPDGAACLYREAVARGEVCGLVNCAGVTFYGPTLDAPPEVSERVLAVNLLAAIRLSTLFLRGFIERGKGALLTVTSLAAIMAMPMQNVYAASKHGLQAFMDGLAREYKGRGVLFSTFAPGGMATEMITLTGLDRVAAFDSPANMSPALAARFAIAAMKKGTGRFVPGLMYKMVVVLARILPRAFVSWSIKKVYTR